MRIIKKVGLTQMVHDPNGSKKAFRIITIGIGIFLLFQNGYLQGVYSGYVNGAQLGGIFYPVHDGFYTSHGDPFFYLINIQVYLNWLLICFLAAKLLDLGSITELVSLVLVIVSLISACYVNNFKGDHSLDESTYINLEPLFHLIISVFGFVLL